MGFCLSCMLFQLPGYKRKASKCKKLIKQVTCRLKFLQARKSAIISQTRDDIAKLLQLGYSQRASILVEQLCEEERRAVAYGVINEICECISNNLPCIGKTSEMPMDVKIAVSSVCLAASRCGELPELNKLRILFRDWYGNEFEASSVNLLPTNLVKSELKTTLSVISTSDDVKLELIKEITKDYAVVMCPPKNCQQFYNIMDEKIYSKDENQLISNEIPEKQYETQQHDGPRSEKMLERGYLSKIASNLMNNLDLWLRKFTKNTHQIQEDDIVHLDDINEETEVTPPQSYSDYEAPVLPLNSNSVSKRTPLCSDLQAYQPLSQQPSRKISNKHMHLDMSTVGGHVHPKLPCYEDLEAKFKRLNARNSR